MCWGSSFINATLSKFADRRRKAASQRPLSASEQNHLLCKLPEALSNITYSYKQLQKRQKISVEYNWATNCCWSCASTSENEDKQRPQMASLAVAAQNPQKHKKPQSVRNCLHFSPKLKWIVLRWKGAFPRHFSFLGRVGNLTLNAV
jgi:hypothetical protein